LQKLAHPQRCLNYGFPWHTHARIEINHEPIGSLEVLGSRVPGMKFNRTDRDKAQQAI
jgi:hypothetical protein